MLAAVVLLAVIGIAAFYWMEGSASARQAPWPRATSGRPVCCGRCRTRRCSTAGKRTTCWPWPCCGRYAAAPDARNLPDNFTAEPVDRLRLVLQAVPRWRDSARSDHLTDLITTIPEKAPDEVGAGRIAGRHLAKSWSWPTSGGWRKDSRQRLKARIEANRDLDGIHIAAVAKLLGLDPTIQDDLLAALLPEADDNPQQLAFGPLPGHRGPDAGEDLVGGDVGAGRPAGQGGRQIPGDAMLAAATRFAPRPPRGLRPTAGRLAEEPVGRQGLHERGQGLQAVNLDDFPPALRGELAGICFQAAQGLVKADQAAAQRALDKAFQLSPSDAGTEAKLLVVDRPAPRAKRPEGDALQGFSDGLSQGSWCRRRSQDALGRRDEMGRRLSATTPLR